MAKKNKKTREENSHEPFFNIFGFIGKLFMPLRRLIDLHVKMAISEFKRDSHRIFEGILSLFSGCFFLIGFWVLLNVLGILALYEFAGLKLFYSVLIVAGANLFLSIFMFITARNKFKKQFFSETRKLFEKTIDDIK